jgi:hypothetical protein
MTRAQMELAESVAWTITFSMLAYGAAMIFSSVYYSTGRVERASENLKETEDPLQRMVGSWFE